MRSLGISEPRQNRSIPYEAVPWQRLGALFHVLKIIYIEEKDIQEKKK